jgi:DNA-binding response OmpR family regulator
MPSVLIAEGEPRIASFVKLGLEANGFRTHLVADGEEAVTLCHRTHFDVLVLDETLVHGWPDLVSELQTNGRHVPVVMLTKRDPVEAAADPVSGRVDDYLRKPFRFSDLLSSVRRMLRP